MAGVSVKTRNWGLAGAVVMPDHLPGDPVEQPMYSLRTSLPRSECRVLCLRNHPPKPVKNTRCTLIPQDTESPTRTFYLPTERCQFMALGQGLGEELGEGASCSAPAAVPIVIPRTLTSFYSNLHFLTKETDFFSLKCTSA